MTTPLLEALAVECGYGRRRIVRGVNVTVRRGEAIAIVGPNASGKSTLLRALAGALPLQAGSVKSEGVDLFSLPARERAKRIAIVPQTARYDLEFTVREIIAMGRSPHADAWGLESADDAAIVKAALELADLADVSQQSFSELSGGERQRALFARAIAQRASLLLLDEPTAHLDLGHQLLVLDRVLAHARAGGGAVVVLHDLALAARLDRVLVLDSGSFVAEGKPAEVLTPALLAKVWGVVGHLEIGASGPALLLEGRAPKPG